MSGFQIHFSSDRVYTPGDMCDVLVAMNAAAIKVNIKSLKPGGKLIANTDGFDAKNLRLANYPDGINPLEDGSLHNYEVIKIDVTKLTREALKDFPELGIKEKDRAKNMFVLGFLYWMYNRNFDSTINFLTEKFGKNELILQSNIKVLQAGYNYGDTTETFTTRYRVEKAKMPSGKYRSIMGNQALAMGLVAATVKSGLPMFLGTYPITPASDILHELSKHKAFGIRTFQAEDEIAGDQLSYWCILWWQYWCYYHLRPRYGIESRSNGAGSNARNSIGNYQCATWRPFYRVAYQNRTK